MKGIRYETPRVLSFASGAHFDRCSVRAAQDWRWPEKPQNLRVLPQEWNGSRLAPVMRGFTRALGVRCSYCHAGREGEPLSTYDFESDENPNKNRARAMLTMLGDINDHLKNIEPSGESRVNMWCHTCHRGRPKPMTLGEELIERYHSGGLDEALAHYVDLKDRFYGRGAYDFRNEGPLNELGYEVLKENDTEGAINVFKMNAAGFPESANVWDSLAEAFLQAGETGKAEEFYRKSLELDPMNQNAKAMLEKIAGDR